MPKTSNTDRLDSTEALTRQLKALLRRDPRLKPIARRAGAFEIRLTPGGFPGLVRVVCDAIEKRSRQVAGCTSGEEFPLNQRIRQTYENRLHCIGNAEGLRCE